MFEIGINFIYWQLQTVSNMFLAYSLNVVYFWVWIWRGCHSSLTLVSEWDQSLFELATITNCYVSVQYIRDWNFRKYFLKRQVLRICEFKIPLALVFSFQSCGISNSVKLKLRKLEYCQSARWDKIPIFVEYIRTVLN